MQQYIVNSDFEGLLKENNLLSPENFLALKENEKIKVRVLRTLSMRANIYFTVETTEKQYGFYLKTHKSLSLWHAFLTCCGLKKYQPPGWVEWEKIYQLTKHLATMTPVVAGILPGKLGKYTGESFCVTEELYDYIQLDHYLQKNPLTLSLIKKVASYAREFHQFRFSHKDFYLCHLFYQPQTEQLALIDLQRLNQPLFFSRWQIKDIAQLNYSTHVLSIKNTDKLRFFYLYFGISFGNKLNKKQKKFITAVLRKTQQMKRHNRGYK